MREHPGLSLIELLVVMAVIAVLSAILFPVLSRAREKARSATCKSNLRQIGIAVKMYCSDWDERMPICKTLFDNEHNDYDPDDPQSILSVLRPYTKDERIFVCPSAVNGQPFSAGPGGWRLTYVTYGYDYEEKHVGREISFLDFEAFDGEPHEAYGVFGHWPPSMKPWVRDSLFRRAPGEPMLFPHFRVFYNLLHADGHVKAYFPRKGVRPFWFF